MSMSAQNSPSPAERGQQQRQCGGAARLLASIGMVGFLSACEVGPDFTPPQAPQVNHYTTESDPKATNVAVGEAQRFFPGAKIDSDWYRLFKSKALDSAIAESLKGNPGLAAAQASLSQAQNNL